MYLLSGLTICILNVLLHIYELYIYTLVAGNIHGVNSLCKLTDGSYTIYIGGGKYYNNTDLRNTLSLCGQSVVLPYIGTFTVGNNMTSCTSTPITSAPEPDSVPVTGTAEGVVPEDPYLLTKTLPSSNSLASLSASPLRSEKASYSCDLTTSIPIMLVKIDLFGYVFVYYTLILYTYTLIL